MSVSKRLSKVFHTSSEIPIDHSSRIVLMSDCHRGDGSESDNFSNNQMLFFSALSYYYEQNYTYIELGDGDELWENRKYDQIISVHSDAFWLISKFYQQDRFYMLYGNHDMIKKNLKFCNDTCQTYFDESKNQLMPLFPEITVLEGLILVYTNTGNKIFLTHGHQGELLNDKIWKVGRFLVRYLWRPLELIGVKNPITARNNYSKIDNPAERKLINWVKAENQMLIAGHTHHPVFPKAGAAPYFNDGSCVHPRCITAIEISNGTISLVKWSVTSKEDRTLYVNRILLAGPVKLIDYFHE